MIFISLRLAHALTAPLEELLGSDPEGRGDYQRISRCIVAHRFSRYPERRAYAFTQLQVTLPFKGGVEVVYFEEEGITSAYLRIAVAPEKLMFVANYGFPYIEEVPDEEEKKLWREAGLVKDD